MPHRNRTLVMVVSLIWVLALVATLINAAVRTGGAPEDGEEGRSALLLAEAPMPSATNGPALTEITPPA